jgi:hypothetical protein
MNDRLIDQIHHLVGCYNVTHDRKLVVVICLTFRKRLLRWPNG